MNQSQLTLNQPIKLTEMMKLASVKILVWCEKQISDWNLPKKKSYATGNKKDHGRCFPHSASVSYSYHVWLTTKTIAPQHCSSSVGRSGRKW